MANKEDIFKNSWNTIPLITAATMAPFTIRIIIIARVSQKISCTAKIIKLPITYTVTFAPPLIYCHNIVWRKPKCTILKITPASASILVQSIAVQLVLLTFLLTTTAQARLWIQSSESKVQKKIRPRLLLPSLLHKISQYPAVIAAIHTFNHLAQKKPFL